MADGGEVLFHFKGDDKQLQSTIDSVHKSLSSLSTGSLEAVSSGFTKLGGVITATATAIIGFGASYNAEIESITMSLETLLGSAEEASVVMERIKSDASTTPFDVRSLAKGEQMLISTGLSAEEAEASMLALGDAISATGGDSATMTRMLANLQQIQNAGKATSMDIRQFAYAGIDIYGLLADSMGKTTAEIQEMQSKGKIGYKEITDALKNASAEGGRFYGAMERQSRTLNGMISNFKDNIGNLTGTLSSGFTNALKKVLPSINDLVNKLNFLLGNNSKFEQFSKILEGIATNISNMIDSLNASQINTIIDGIVALGKTAPIMLLLGAILPKVGSAFDLIFGPSSGIVGFLASLTKGIPILSQVMDILNMMSSPLLSLVASFFKLGAGITAVVGVLGYLDQEMNGTLTRLSKAFADSVPQIIDKFVNKFIKSLPQILKTGQNILSNLVKGIKKSLPSLIKMVEAVLLSITNTLEKNGPEIAEVVTTAIIKLTESIYKSEPSFIRAVIKIFEGVMRSLKDNLPQLLVLSTETTNQVLDVIIKELPTFIALGSQVIMALIQGLVDRIPALINQLPRMIDLMANTILGMDYLLRQVGVKLIIALAEGIKNYAQNLPNIASQIMQRMINTLLSWLGQYSTAGVRLLQSFGQGMSNQVGNLLSRASNAISSIVGRFRGYSLYSIGSNLLIGLWNGMSDKVGWILSRVGGIAYSVLSKVRSIFGVHSPSKEFAYIGEMNAEGLMQGMLGKENEIQAMIDGAFNLQPNVSPTMTITQESPFAQLMEYEQKPVLIDVRADEGIIVKKATEGFREFQRANGRLPF